MKLIINSKEDIVAILNYLKPYEQSIGKMTEGSYEYERACEWVERYLLEIDEALIGNEMINSKNIFNALIRMFSYWDYLKNEISLGELFDLIKEHSNKTLFDI